MRVAIALLSCTPLASPAFAQERGVPGQRKPEFTVTGSINKPTQMPANVAGLKAPAGYQVSVAAENLGNARIVATAPDGTVYISRRTEADILMLKDVAFANVPTADEPGRSG